MKARNYYNTFLFFTLCVNFTLYSQDSPEAIFVNYDPACMVKCFYHKEGEIPGSHYDEYNLNMNDSTIVSFVVMRVSDMRSTIESMPLNPIGCDNKRLTIKTITDVNEAKKTAYLIEETALGLTQSLISEITVKTKSKGFFSYRSAEYSIAFNTKTVYTGEELFGGNDNATIGLLLAGENAVLCKPTYTFQELLGNDPNLNATINYIPDVGLYSKVFNGGAFQLLLVNNESVGTFLQRLCDTDASVFKPVASPVSLYETTPSPPRTFSDDGVFTRLHTVRPGETLSSIASSYPGITAANIKTWNGLTSDAIRPGQKLNLFTNSSASPTTGSPTHVVSEGENLLTIADRYDVSINELFTWNNLNSAVLTPGQVIFVTPPAIPIASQPTLPGAPVNNVVSTPVPEKVEPPTQTVSPPEALERSAALKHKVQSGETLYGISRKYNTSVANITQWNNMQGTGVRLGEEIWVTNPADVVSAPTTSSPSTDNASEERPTGKGTTVSNKWVIYQVQQGDNLLSIAEKFKVSDTDLIVWNKLTEDIKSGEALKIQTTEPTQPAPTPPTATKPSPSPAPSANRHVVKSKETLYGISRSYNISVDELKKINNLKTNEVKIGQVLIVAPVTTSSHVESSASVQALEKKKSAFHVVQKGEGLFRIAKKYGMSVTALKSINRMKKDIVYVGQKLRVSS